MNFRKTIIIFGGLGIIVVLLLLRFGGGTKVRKQTLPAPNRAAAQNVVKPAAPAVPQKKNTPPSKAAPGTAVRKALPREQDQQGRFSKEEQALGLGDPFVYAGTGSGDYTPLSGGKQVGAISVKGIICLKGQEPKAILQLKDSGRVHYVSKNSVIRVSTKGKKGSTPAEAYIVVKEIRNDEVELIQLERPDKVIIIR